ncbi:MAG TPA: hypothetical protein VK607_00950, partial [Kofleriaceae bacterium]|nr:hypothetical protein [Kofleriaceae bacterium]
CSGSTRPASSSAALAGELEAALAELSRLAAPGAAAGDELAAARIVAARGQILLAADHAAEAGDVLDGLGPARRGEPGRAARLPAAEQLEIALAGYEARLIAPGARKPVRPALLDALHPRAPVRARFELLDARHAPPEQPAGRAFALDTALRLLLEAGAAPVAIADVRWQRAQLRLAGSDYRGLAATAREAFQAAGRTAEVAEIDRWLASLPAP